MKINFRNELPFLFLLLVTLLLFSSCKGDKQKSEAKKMVAEWVGKEIKFPEEFTCSLLGKDTLSSLCSDLFNKEYKILLYVDSTGCTSCKLQLYAWNQLMQEVDSLFSNQVSFLYFFHPKDRRNLNFLLKRDNLNYPVFIDSDNKINQLNNFSDQSQFQCFLLDKDNKVLMIGNPVSNVRIWELYKEQILGLKSQGSTDLITVEIENTNYDYGEILINESKESIFRITNTGKEPLIITRVVGSCGCTSINWDKRPIEVGQSTEIKVIMTPDEEGYFNKTVDVYGNLKNGPLKLNVSGTTVKKE